MHRRKLHIRPFQSGDQKAAAAVILSGLAERFEPFDQTSNPDVDDITTNYIAAGNTFLVTTIDGELVATAALVEDSDGVGRIVRMSVCRERRREGIGRAMTQRLIEIAKDRGFKRLKVETNLDWCDAIGFYRQCGFTQHRSDDVSAYMSMHLK